MDISKSLQGLKNLQLGSLFGSKKNQSNPEPKVKEINLVPDIKNDFIKTLKFRNLVFFICIVTSISSVAVILIFLSIVGGQQSFISAKQNTIESLQKKIEDYSDLSDFLTIRDQLSNIATITENKKVVSRTFNILSAIIPMGPDTISVSKLSVNLTPEESENPTFEIEAQANAGSEPYIDYKVLDGFKKSMDYIRYDYGEYVDKDGQSIPAYCMIEKAADGSFLYDNAKGYYAYWLIEGEGCNPSSTTNEDKETSDNQQEDDSSSSDTSLKTSPLQSTTLNNSSSSSVLSQILNNDNKLETETPLAEQQPTEIKEISGYPVIDYEGQKVVQIWRTPQYDDWYKTNPKEDEPYMTLEGEIHNVPHFNSACNKYTGTETDKKVNWSVANESCVLVPESEYDEEGETTGGVVVTESNNARDEDDGKLVLRFSAIITLNPEVFNFNKHHLIVIPPSGRRNVTDSYVQIQSIFAKRAQNCSKDDAECNNTPTDSSNSNKQEEDKEE